MSVKPRIMIMCLDERHVYDLDHILQQVRTEATGHIKECPCVKWPTEGVHDI
jgi:hypothetical protein